MSSFFQQDPEEYWMAKFPALCLTVISSDFAVWKLGKMYVYFITGFFYFEEFKYGGVKLINECPSAMLFELVYLHHLWSVYLNG